MMWASIGSSIWSGLKQIPKWVWWALLALAGLWALRADARRDGRKQEEAEQEVRDLVLREQAEKQVNEIIEEERTNADETLEAGRSAMRAEPHPSDSMSDDEFFYTYGYRRPERKTKG